MSVALPLRVTQTSNSLNTVPYMLTGHTKFWSWGQAWWQEETRSSVAERINK